MPSVRIKSFNIGNNHFINCYYNSDFKAVEVNEQIDDGAIKTPALVMALESGNIHTEEQALGLVESIGVDGLIALLRKAG